MPQIKAVITDYDLITAYGRGVDCLWEGISSGQSQIEKLERFPTQSFLAHNAALVCGLDPSQDESLAMQMLKMVLVDNLKNIPPDALLILATTVGEIDLLEKAVLSKTHAPAKSNLNLLLKKLQKLTGLKKGLLISCACASSSSALSQAARMIESGQADCCAVVAVDAVSEFVFSGFSALMALDKNGAKPFDQNRMGLSLGEAGGFILLMSAARAKKEKRVQAAQIAGWGLSCDANHMTGPSRTAEGLIQAINCALKKARMAPGSIGGISSHGTGTLYNDAMELFAYKKIFKNKALPVYSIKGGTGHTLGAAGLIETILALKVLQKKIIPGTVGLKNIDNQAIGWVNPLANKLNKPTLMLNNCGFGGVNAVLILKHLN
jgi:3-oxoacyl-[acyl-carrier-protein] synthase II